MSIGAQFFHAESHFDIGSLARPNARDQRRDELTARDHADHGGADCGGPNCDFR
jgi:hypothetical protein